MNIFSNLIRDHSLLILTISSVVSLTSGIFITYFGSKRDKVSHNFYLKQEFYTNFLVHQLIARSKDSNLKLENHDEVLNQLRFLNAEMLLKADISMIRDFIAMEKIFKNNSNPDYLAHQVVKIINKFRKSIHNKPITVNDFKELIESIGFQPKDILH